MMTVSMTVAEGTTAVAPNQTMIALVGTMAAPVPTSVMVLILVAPLSQIMDAPDQITVDHRWGQTMIVPMVNDLKGATDQAAAVSEDLKDTVADVEVTGAAAGKTSVTNAVAMVIR